LHLADSAHLNDLGQLAMAYVMLKGLGVPEEVSPAEADKTRLMPETLRFSRRTFPARPVH
jgi:hypothetical protein